MLQIEADSGPDNVTSLMPYRARPRAAPTRPRKVGSSAELRAGVIVSGMLLVVVATFGCNFTANLDGASCQSDEDCVAGGVCRSGYCVSSDATRCIDRDGDGAPRSEGCGGPVDCDDGDPERAPGLEETCDGIDNDCDGEVDEGVKRTFYRDGDRDGYGTDSDTIQGCSSRPKYVAKSGDCDDGNASVHPGEEETCNQVDDDCDGIVDNLPGSSGSEENTKTNCGGCGIDCTEVWEHAAEVACESGACKLKGCESPYFNVDGDPKNGCEYECGYAAQNDGAVESQDAVCDDLDEDCDGEVDEDFAQVSEKGTSCSRGVGACESDGERVCNSAGDGLTCNAEPKQPESGEVCDGIDNDCDGKVDNDPQESSSTTTYYRDEDKDGFGVKSTTREFCDGETPPDVWAEDFGDCLPQDAGSNPDASEECDGKDNDCDEETDEISACICEFGEVEEFGSETGACETGKRECIGTDYRIIEQPKGPTQELCDTTDHDCDGESNDVFRCDGGNCGNGQRQVCKEDGTYGGCESTPSTESNCTDGLDNDCDGDVDGADSDCP